MNIIDVIKSIDVQDSKPHTPLPFCFRGIRVIGMLAIISKCGTEKMFTVHPKNSLLYLYPIIILPVAPAPGFASPPAFGNANGLWSSHISHVVRKAPFMNVQRLQCHSE